MYLREKVYRCPWVKCENTKFLVFEEVKVHLYKGFTSGYWYWTSHGEFQSREDEEINMHYISSSPLFQNHDMPTDS